MTLRRGCPGAMGIGFWIEIEIAIEIVGSFEPFKKSDFDCDSDLDENMQHGSSASIMTTERDTAWHCMRGG
ncbi:MAG: hypothetical protein ABIL58_21585 [Pseudomonadota bacterium]